MTIGRARGAPGDARGTQGVRAWLWALAVPQERARSALGARNDALNACDCALGVRQRPRVRQHHVRGMHVVRFGDARGVFWVRTMLFGCMRQVRASQFILCINQACAFQYQI